MALFPDEPPSGRGGRLFIVGDLRPDTSLRRRRRNFGVDLGRGYSSTCWVVGPKRVALGRSCGRETGPGARSFGRRRDRFGFRVRPGTPPRRMQRGSIIHSAVTAIAAVFRRDILRCLRCARCHGDGRMCGDAHAHLLRPPTRRAAGPLPFLRSWRAFLTVRSPRRPWNYSMRPTIAVVAYGKL